MTSGRQSWRREFVAAVYLLVGGISLGVAFDLVPTTKYHVHSVGQSTFQWQRGLFKNDELLANELSSTSSTSSISATPTPRPHRIHFAAPLLDYGHPPTIQELGNGTLSEKPILLYLPGFDGTYVCPFIQYPELGTEFEVWCMTIDMSDRTTFDELRMCILDFIDKLGTSEEVDPASELSEQLDLHAIESNEETAYSQSSNGPFWSGWFSSGANKNRTLSKKKKRQLYLAGESFGGILAAEIALTLLETPKMMIDLHGLVLINPATCYDRSQLAAKGPPVIGLPALFYPFGLASLLPLFTDDYSFQQLILILSARALPSVIDDPVRESFMGRVAFSLPAKLKYMSQGTLEWRLDEWLEIGCDKLATRIRDFENHPSFRSLILAGESDLALPSIAEAERLVNLLPKCQVHVVEGAGHASTCGSRVDMAAEMRKAFPELQRTSTNKRQPRNSISSKRTAMKPKAANGTGPDFGMEPRYDGASIGLHPILYWSSANFQPVKKREEKEEVIMPDTNDMTTYSISRYELPVNRS